MNAIKVSGRRDRVLRAGAKLSAVTVCGIAFGFMAQVLLLTLLSANSPGTRDYVVYWATGHQFANHANPYDRVALLSVERSAGFPQETQTMFMRNPPWTLPLVLPLGYLGARAGWLLWSALLLGCLGISVHTVWLMSGKPSNRRYLIGYTFAPALICIIYGQTSLIALLGLVMFLRLHRTHPLFAGASLGLCAAKPHLFIPIGVVFLPWVVVSKAYKVGAGLAMVMVASCAMVTWIDPIAWNGYFAMLRTSSIDRDIIPCLSYLVRHSIHTESRWLQYLPAFLGSAWALSYFWPRRNHWNWTEDGSIVMLVSILSAPYCWLFDQVLAIPALLRGAFRTRSGGLLIAVAFASALIEIALFYEAWKPSAVHLWTYWTAPTWLVWYLSARLMQSKQTLEGASNHPD
jgi:hypothetical protein